MEKQANAKSYSQTMTHAYDQRLTQVHELLKREDFYGLIGKIGVDSFTSRLSLNADSHILDLCCGVGGPARYLAKKYSSKVLGIDIVQNCIDTAIKQTQQENLSSLVSFIHGNIFDVPLPVNHFTHVFGCDAWVYFKDKLELFKLVYDSLKPGGIICFIDPAKPGPEKLTLQFELFLGTHFYETRESYEKLLTQAGFAEIEIFDLGPETCKDIQNTLYNQLNNRDEIERLVGKDYYYGMMHIWTEALTYYSLGNLKQFGVKAIKK